MINWETYKIATKDLELNFPKFKIIHRLIHNDCTSLRYFVLCAKTLAGVGDDILKFRWSTTQLAFGVSGGTYKNIELREYLADWGFTFPTVITMFEIFYNNYEGI